jgi:hypothetical protein
MLSRDLKSLRGALECYAERLGGRLSFNEASTADLFRTLDGLIVQAEGMEGAPSPPAVRIAGDALPSGVADLAARRAAMRQERPTKVADHITGWPCPTNPTGGSAA